MPCYAQLTADGFVHTVCDLSGEFDTARMVEIESIDTSLLGQHYADGKFTPPEAPTPT